MHGTRFAEPLAQKVCCTGLRVGLMFCLLRMLIRPELLMVGIALDAVSSGWASLRREMVCAVDEVRRMGRFGRSFFGKGMVGKGMCSEAGA